MASTTISHCVFWVTTIPLMILSSSISRNKEPQCKVFQWWKGIMKLLNLLANQQLLKISFNKKKLYVLLQDSRPYQSKYPHYKFDKIKRKRSNEVIKPYNISLVLANTIYTRKIPLGICYYSSCYLHHGYTY